MKQHKMGAITLEMLSLMQLAEDRVAKPEALRAKAAKYATNRYS